MTVCIRRTGWAKPFLISSDDERITDFFVRYHNGSICSSADTDGSMIDIITADSSSIVRYNDQAITTDSPIQTVLNLMFDEANYRSDTFPLHGGAVEVCGKACLFLASTKTGKTTLITYLTKSGYPYINDDHIIVDTDTLSIITDITPIHLRPQSLPVIKQYGYSIDGVTVKDERIHRIIYSPEGTELDTLPIECIYFIERDEKVNACSPIEKSEAVKLLMSGLLSPNAADARRLRCAIRLSGRCKRLVYSDMRYVAELLKSKGD